ncbi:MAG TPA: peroxiredoxin [Polyangiaceae bacterium]|jgi:peroxiredoxin Q/BCP
MTLAVGDRAPDFTLPGGPDGTSVSLKDLLAKGPVVVFFYPKDDTPGCTVEACTFRDSYDAFSQAGAAVVGISSDSVASHDRFASKHKLPMTLLSDADGKVRAAYGVKATLGLFPGRATFVIDPGGTVRHVFVSQLRVETHVEKALGVVKALAQGKKSTGAAAG